MMIERVTDKYQLWKDGGEYVLTVTYRRTKYELCRGSMADCERFMGAHPYGIPRIKAEAMGRVLS